VAILLSSWAPQVRHPCGSAPSFLAQGDLHIKLATVERESLNFGWVAAKMRGVQETFYDVNKAIFPDLEQLPSLPDTLFHAEMLNTATANDPPLRVLSLGASCSP
jgi:hypothetical protein